MRIHLNEIRLVKLVRVGVYTTVRLEGKQLNYKTCGSFKLTTICE